MDRMEKEIEKIVFLMEIKKEKHVFSKEILPSHKKRMDDISNTIYKDYDPKKFMNLSFPEGDDIKKEIEDLKSIDIVFLFLEIVKYTTDRSIKIEFFNDDLGKKDRINFDVNNFKYFNLKEFLKKI